MSPLRPDPRDPRQIAAAAVADARLHDVVVGASKLLHNAKLESRDTEALKWALMLLESAVSRNVVFEMPSSQQLSSAGGTVSAIRRAAYSAADDMALDHLRDGLRAALGGRRDSEVMPSIERLRALFAMVSQVSLSNQVQRATRPGSNTWLPKSTLASHL